MRHFDWLPYDDSEWEKAAGVAWPETVEKSWPIGTSLSSALAVIDADWITLHEGGLDAR